MAGNINICFECSDLAKELANKKRNEVAEKEIDAIYLECTFHHQLFHITLFPCSHIRHQRNIGWLGVFMASVPHYLD